MKQTSYWDPIIADNRALENAGMPYRYTASGIAVCAECGNTYFRRDRITQDCTHYDQTIEFNPAYNVKD